jgi:hypothetical protein
MTTTGVSVSDFTGILNDMGVTVSYQVVTKSVNQLTGEEVSSFATGSNQTCIFFLDESKYLWDKEGLIQVSDAYLLTPITLNAKRYDQITINGISYYIDNVTRRTVLTVDMFDFCNLFRVK